MDNITRHFLAICESIEKHKAALEKFKQSVKLSNKCQHVLTMFKQEVIKDGEFLYREEDVEVCRICDKEISRTSNRHKRIEQSAGIDDIEQNT